MVTMVGTGRALAHIRVDMAGTVVDTVGTGADRYALQGCY